MRVRWLGPERRVVGFKLQQGQEVDLPDADARQLIESGRAMAVPAAATESTPRIAGETAWARRPVPRVEHEE